MISHKKCLAPGNPKTVDGRPLSKPQARFIDALQTNGYVTTEKLLKTTNHGSIRYGTKQLRRFVPLVRLNPELIADRTKTKWFLVWLPTHAELVDLPSRAKSPPKQESPVEAFRKRPVDAAKADYLANMWQERALRAKDPVTRKKNWARCFLWRRRRTELKLNLSPKAIAIRKKMNGQRFLVNLASGMLKKSLSTAQQERFWVMREEATAKLLKLKTEFEAATNASELEHITG